MNLNFNGKKVLVTGAGRGIGRAVATALARSGCKVYALSRTKATLDTLVEEYPDIIPITQDLQDWDKTRETLEQLEALDGLVNNAAAYPPMVQVLDVAKDHLDTCLQTNLYSAINCTQVVAKKMIASGTSGSIVNVSSVIGPLAFPNALSYGIAKAGIDFATKQCALEFGPHNIRVNSVNPGFVRTELADTGEYVSTLPAYSLFLERSPMGKVSAIPDVVSPILYLLSDCSAMVTGTSHIIDGGLACNITTKP